MRRPRRNATSRTPSARSRPSELDRPDVSPLFGWSGGAVYRPVDALNRYRIVAQAVAGARIWRTPSDWPTPSLREMPDRAAHDRLGAGVVANGS